MLFGSLIELGHLVVEGINLVLVGKSTCFDGAAGSEWRARLSDELDVSSAHLFDLPLNIIDSLVEFLVLKHSVTHADTELRVDAKIGVVVRPGILVGRFWSGAVTSRTGGRLVVGARSGDARNAGSVHCLRCNFASEHL